MIYALHNLWWFLTNFFLLDWKFTAQIMCFSVLPTSNHLCRCCLVTNLRFTAYSYNNCNLWFFCSWYGSQQETGSIARADVPKSSPGDRPGSCHSHSKVPVVKNHSRTLSEKKFVTWVNAKGAEPRICHKDWEMKGGPRDQSESKGPFLSAGEDDFRLPW